MANVKLSELTAAATAAAANEFEINEAGTSKKVTGTQLKAFVKSGLVTADVTDITSTAAELNILDGVTASAAELNALDGITSTVTELNYTDGVTSAIQTQMDAKAPLASPTFTGVPAVPTATVGTDTTQAASTAFVLANAGGGVTVISETVVSTAVSSIDLTGFVPADYSSYEIELMNITPVNDQVTVQLRTSSDGGSTYDSGGSDYEYATGGPTSGGGIFNFSASAGAAQMEFTSNLGNASGEDGVSGFIRISGADLVKKTMCNSHLTYFTNVGELRSASGGGVRQSQADVDGVRLFFSAGNIASGTVVFRGIK
jgi:hypothetical protein